jgi:hypothetical protein
MTTADYEIVADAIRAADETDVDTPDGVEMTHAIVDRLCEAFAKDNPHFHKATFYRRALGYLPSEANR